LRGSIKGESQKNMTVVPIFAQKTLHVEEIEPSEELKKSEEPQKTHSSSTLDLATQDVRIVIEEQKQQGHLLTTKLNILFVVNGALFTTLMISRLVLLPSIFLFAPSSSS
jgi:hypothetical protein